MSPFMYGEQPGVSQGLPTRLRAVAANAWATQERWLESPWRYSNKVGLEPISSIVTLYPVSFWILRAMESKV